MGATIGGAVAGSKMGFQGGDRFAQRGGPFAVGVGGKAKWWRTSAYRSDEREGGQQER